ncbi:hypothetical protein [Spirosoma endbachense]|uniref:Uncharacterized protein n=1 Tax=Spirosoma endbachense TaxID=2666025 RepID=A0A6P1VUS1_9BACT|nr:hypothetical protein [Spirosoma endbachense]QHV95126.1 hypothetical protein GJR95_08900 [Spirosoma endbachense]
MHAKHLKIKRFDFTSVNIINYLLIGMSDTFLSLLLLPDFKMTYNVLVLDVLDRFPKMAAATAVVSKTTYASYHFCWGLGHDEIQLKYLSQLA